MWAILMFENTFAKGSNPKKKKKGIDSKKMNMWDFSGESCVNCETFKAPCKAHLEHSSRHTEDWSGPNLH